MANKVTFAQRAQVVATDLANVVTECADLAKVWADRTYNVGGANVMVDADVASIGLKAADVGSMITLCQQIGIIFGNTTGYIQADYKSTLSKMRTDV